MSVADTLRLLDLEATVAELRARLADLEATVADSRARCEARQGAGTAARTPGALDCGTPSQGLSSAPVSDAGAVVLGKHGGDRKSEAVRDRTCSARLKYGTSAYWLSRLDRDRPDLAEGVRAGELSPHAAAILAGFRKRMITVPAGPNAATDLN